MIIGKHIGSIQTRVSAKLRILQQTRRPNRQRVGNAFKIGPKLIGDPGWKIGVKKDLRNFFIRFIGFCQLLEIIFLDEGIKAFGGHHQCLGNENVDIFKFFLDGRQALNQVGNKGQTPSLSAQRAFADFKKFGRRIKIAGIKVDHHAFLAPLAPALNHCNQVFAVAFNAGEIIIAQRAYFRCQYNFGARKQPPG